MWTSLGSMIVSVNCCSLKSWLGARGGIDIHIACPEHVKVMGSSCLQLHWLMLMLVSWGRFFYFMFVHVAKRSFKMCVECSEFYFLTEKFPFSAILVMCTAVSRFNRNVTDILFPPILACLCRVYPWSMNACGRYIKDVKVMPSVSTYKVCGFHPHLSQQAL